MRRRRTFTIFLWALGTLVAEPGALARRVAVVGLPPRGATDAEAEKVYASLAQDLGHHGLEVIPPERSRALLSSEASRAGVTRARLRRLETLVHEGQSRVRDLRLAAAVTSLAEARGLLAVAGPYVASPRTLAALHFHLGVALQRLGERTLAEQAYVRAASLDPEFEPSPTEWPPDITRKVESARQAARAARPCALRVTSSPARAVVRWNGKSVGVTPLELRLPPGEHYLLFEAPAHVPEARTVQACAAPSLASDLAPEHAPIAAQDLAAGRPAAVQAALGALGARDLLVLRLVADGSVPSLQYRLCRQRGAVTCSEGNLPLSAGRESLAADIRDRLKPVGPRRRWYATWWFWTGVGAAVATAIVVPVALSHHVETKYVVQGAPAALRW